ncbi:MAG: aminodeoxychorismate synthase component I [Geminicoccaceae bacterium]
MPYIEPVAVAETLRTSPGFVFLDSAGEDRKVGRYSFIGCMPFGEFTIEAGLAFWNGERREGQPLERFRELLDQFRIVPTPHGPPLCAGCIGHISYDLGQILEQLDAPEPAAPRSSDLRFGFYDVIYAFDRQARRFWLCSSGLPETEPKARAARAKDRMDDALDRLRSEPPIRRPAVPVANWTSNFTPEAFQAAVEQVRGYIRKGDIYQANLTQRFEASLPGGFDAWAFYCNLRRVNPAPFAAYLSDAETVFASSSPERFIGLRDGVVEARPIKGTCRRAIDPEEDQALGMALLDSEKDRAENIMIVDLLRNDISRVCVPGSVEVPVLCGLESYAGIHHLTSVVRGRMQPEFGAVDLIEACFPGGSITGAPKIRAMHIITELEQVARGIYCGSMGYVGFDGAMDLNIAIRTAVIGEGRAVFQTGGGITLLSEAAAEHTETLTKADRLFAAFASTA